MQTEANVVEYFEYFCQISSKSILIISSYTVWKLLHFFTHSIVGLRGAVGSGAVTVFCTL